MKKTIFSFILLFNLLCLNAQDITQMFVRIPNEYFPLLTQERRSELLHRYYLAKIDTITNNFRGTSKLETLDIANNYMKLRLTNQSTFELKIWQTSDSTKIVGFIHVVCAPVCDSHIAFFDVNFKRLDLNEAVLPEFFISDFLDKNKIIANGETVENLVKKYDILFGTLSISGENIVLQSNTKDFLPIEIYREIEPYLLGDKIELTWSNGIFKKGETTW